MFFAAIRWIQSAWSTPPSPSSRTHHHQADTTIESLLEPIRYSMAFLTLFSILSTVIIAIILVPFGPLQLLAQLISLIVSLSGLFGTFKRSILFSSIYALSMLLFLFLQCSYFFVLLKLVQEVNLGTANSNNNSGDKFVYSPTDLTGTGYLSTSTDNMGQYPNLYTLSTNSGTLTPRFPSSSSGAKEPETLPQPVESQGPYFQLERSVTSYPDPDQIGHYHRSAMINVHVRHISEMLNEELAYLSLLTVPMLAWLPPSLFMESVAVLLLSMQALAGACFLYALRRSESFYNRSYFASKTIGRTPDSPT